MTFDEFCGLTILFFVLRGVWRGFERDVYFTGTASQSSATADISASADGVNWLKADFVTNPNVPPNEIWFAPKDWETNSDPAFYGKLTNIEWDK